MALTPQKPTPPAEAPKTEAPKPETPTAQQPQMVQAPAIPDERYRKVTLDEAGSTFAYNDASKNGVTVNRIDFIRSAWQVGRKSRGATAKELTRLTGKKVTYQIIFSATRGLPGGPVQPTEPQPNPTQAQTPAPNTPATQTPQT